MDMQHVRHFYLESSSESIDLNGKPYLFQKSSGLGFDTDYQYVRIGSVFIRTQGDVSQLDKNGTIVIRGNTREEVYAYYKQLAGFISRNKDDLKLAYLVPGNSYKYYMDVDVSSLSKEEVGLFSLNMVCDITFSQRSKWYRVRRVEYSVPSGSGLGKTYDYSYDYTYFDTASGDISVSMESEASPCIITIMGPCVNPHWTLMKDNEEVMSGGWTGTLSDDDTLTINSIDGQTEATYHNATANTDTDVYQDLDFDAENFIVFPAGDSTLSFTQTGESGFAFSVQIREEYDAI